MGIPNLQHVHRLDRLTSGVLIFAKNKKTNSKLRTQIQNQEFKKSYISRVAGNFPDGLITVPFIKHFVFST
jgi:tRNA pseudouridine32 synthase/23S rRNA pseudouridine746 synthase